MTQIHSCSLLKCTDPACWECMCAQCVACPARLLRSCLRHQSEVAPDHAAAHGRQPVWRWVGATGAEPSVAAFSGETVRSLAEGILGVLHGMHGQFPYHPPIAFCERAVEAARALTLSAYPQRGIGVELVRRPPAVVREEQLDLAWVAFSEAVRVAVLRGGGDRGAMKATLALLESIDLLWLAGHEAVRRHRASR